MNDTNKDLITLLKIIVIFFITIVVLVGVKYRFSIKKYVESVIEEEYLDFNIVDNFESDTDIIDNMFMRGMSVEDFKNTIKEKNNYVNKSGKYQLIDYNFEYMPHYS